MIYGRGEDIPFFTAGFEPLARATDSVPHRRQHFDDVAWRTAVAMINIPLRIHTATRTKQQRKLKTAEGTGGPLARVAPSY